MSAGVSRYQMASDENFRMPKPGATCSKCKKGFHQNCTPVIAGDIEAMHYCDATGGNEHDWFMHPECAFALGSQLIASAYEASPKGFTVKDNEEMNRSGYEYGGTE